MAGLVRIGAVNLTLHQSGCSITQFSDKCAVDVKATFDLAEYLSGGQALLQSMSGIRSRILPLVMEMHAGKQVYGASADREEAPYFWFPRESQGPDTKHRYSTACRVSVPRGIWPSRAGSSVQILLRASQAVEFIHPDGKSERVMKQSEWKTFTVVAS